MLSTLITNEKEYPKFIDICDNINHIYELLNAKQFDLVKETVDKAIGICNDIKLQAVKYQNENVAIALM